eukprot:GFUD01132254.1.p1 GENE.GFUD01132254.1~~GFUD01132254.1.p1  ORF type:complete len:206 (-),score=13.68 GFUD01132254.1:134-751(-)
MCQLVLVLLAMVAGYAGGFPSIADKGTETVDVPEHPRCEKCLIEDNCTNCSEPCSYYGKTTECYECINATCPDCLGPCGFIQIADFETGNGDAAETGDAAARFIQIADIETGNGNAAKTRHANETVRCIMNNYMGTGEYFGKTNLNVPTWQDCQQQCRYNTPVHCMFWNWGYWQGTTQCWMFTSLNYVRWYSGWVAGYRCQNEGE